jgi:hypothetical protein
MNKVRRKIVVDAANDTLETLNKGAHRTVSRERIVDLVNMIAELFQEIEDSKKIKITDEAIQLLEDNRGETSIEEFASLMIRSGVASWKKLMAKLPEEF